MIDLRDTTFIIPIRIESPDRAFNFRYTIQFLCQHLETNIMIWESAPIESVDAKWEPTGKKLLRQIRPFKSKITYHYQPSEPGTAFHRTRLLNEMLCEVKTPIVVNYDCDILLQPNTYYQAAEAIREGKDLVYPYFKGESQKKVYRTTFRSNLLEEQKHEPAQSLCGHCQFFDRVVYWENGGENEHFLSYGPEDVERMERFQKLGYSVHWLEGHHVYHIEHDRGPDSGRDNPHFENNNKLLESLRQMNAAQLKEYYKHTSYMDKYRKPHIQLVTFATPEYYGRQEALANRALELQTVDSVLYGNLDTIKAFTEEGRELLKEKRGAGYWSWKPWLILEAMEELQDGDIIVYLDCGDHISSNFRTFLERRMRAADVLLTLGGYPCGMYTKMDCFKAMGCDEPVYYDALQVEAGVVVCKKNDVSIHLMKEWLQWCLDPRRLVTDDKSKAPNLPEFVDHRHDQSILSIMRVFHSIPATHEMRQFINCNQNG